MLGVVLTLHQFAGVFFLQILWNTKEEQKPCSTHQKALQFRFWIKVTGIEEFGLDH